MKEANTSALVGQKVFSWLPISHYPARKPSSCMQHCRHATYYAQVPAATLHAALLPHDWRSILDTSFGLLHGGSTLGSQEQAVWQSSASFRRPAETAALSAGRVLLRKYLQVPQEAAQTSDCSGEQLAGEGNTGGVVSHFNALERLQRLGLAAAPPGVAGVYGMCVAEAAAEDARLCATLAAALAECFDCPTTSS